MPETALEEVIQEQEFTLLLRSHAARFLGIVRLILEAPGGRWSKQVFQRVAKEAEDLESFLDDYGAANNRTFHYLRELLASVRWFAMAGLSVTHLSARIPSYRIAEDVGREALQAGQRDLGQVRVYLGSTAGRLLHALVEESQHLGILKPEDPVATISLDGAARPRRRLPRNVGEEDLVDEQQKIAEVASKFVAACEMLDDIGSRQVHDAEKRHKYLQMHCREEQARVFEATVHNLQSTYDTNVKQTAIESRDPRLRKLRGFSSVALHLLEAVTFLVHFVDRHEGGKRSEAAEQRILRLAERADVEDVVLNKLLYWANQTMRRGRAIAEDLLPSYTNVRELEVELPDELKLHARPASLIVGIVCRYGTPVELEVDGVRCNAGSILELLVTVGSHPDAREFRFRGDENPLKDIALLFAHALGERGLEQLPECLQYLRES